MAEEKDSRHGAEENLLASGKACQASYQTLVCVEAAACWSGAAAGALVGAGGD